jgi:hypothetical protein
MPPAVLALLARPMILGGFALAVSSLACGHVGADPAVPTYAPTDQSTAGAAKSASRPLILEWPAADRAALEAQRTGGVVVVRYGGGEIDVLRGCHVAAAYRYVPITPKEEDLVMRDADELAAEMPIHTVKLAARIAQKQELDVAMTVVGMYQADARAWKASDLQGDCAGATHVVQAVAVGAFEIDASAQAAQSGSVTAMGAGVSGSHEASREVLHRDGDKSACAKSGGQDAAPPYGCGAMLRLEVAAVRFPVASSAACGQGLVRQGDSCVAVQGDRPGLLDALKSGGH